MRFSKRWQSSKNRYCVMEKLSLWTFICIKIFFSVFPGYVPCSFARFSSRNAKRIGNWIWRMHKLQSLLFKRPETIFAGSIVSACYDIIIVRSLRSKCNQFRRQPERSLEEYFICPAASISISLSLSVGLCRMIRVMSTRRPADIPSGTCSGLVHRPGVMPHSSAA